jgi:hypothetical protein
MWHHDTSSRRRFKPDCGRDQHGKGTKHAVSNHHSGGSVPAS